MSAKRIYCLCILSVIGFFCSAWAVDPAPVPTPPLSQPSQAAKTEHHRHATLREAEAQENSTAQRSYGGKAEGRRHEDVSQDTRDTRPDKRTK